MRISLSLGRVTTESRIRIGAQMARADDEFNGGALTTNGCYH
jgi:hypothetical protein